MSSVSASLPRSVPHIAGRLIRGKTQVHVGSRLRSLVPSVRRSALPLSEGTNFLLTYLVPIDWHLLQMNRSGYEFASVAERSR